MKKSKKTKEYALANYKPDNPALTAKWVGLSNALVRSGQALNLAEKRLLMLAVSKLDSSKALSFGEVPTSRVHAADYAKEYGVNPNTAYEALQAASKSLYERSITMFEPAHTRQGKPLKPIVTNMRWVGRAQYHEGEGWIELGWWPELLPHLTGLKREFTKYKLQQANALRSIYSWRLLELLMHYQSTGVAEYTIEDFCTSMEATEKQKQNFAKIRTKIIEPAVKELIEKDGWLIEWRPMKTGRKVSKLRFEFKKTIQPSLFPPP
jgi:plasmid replication initiation protein